MKPHHRVAWYGAILGAVFFCLGAADDWSVDEREPLSWILENAVSFLLLGAVALGLIVWGVFAARRLAQRKTEEAEAMMRFEASMGTLMADRLSRTRSQASLTASPAAAAGAPAAAGAAAQTSTVPASTDTRTIPAPSGTASEAAQAIEAVLDKLRAGGLFAGLEGTLFLSDGVSEGKIVRLTNGKTAVVLPGVEPADFLARQLRRFDLCLIALGGDTACVVTPLGSYMADHFTL